eukprot:TRINITY_DN3006_c0_g1_i2.p2 TRINITY_DN3006_c0_g1~~TRINITY_DN3006_c0_g1_i2.p2  ORF type:complete len:136 (+),score=39.41 TRINITY_DN3006_c0_g1_i2:201-608(+)
MIVIAELQLVNTSLELQAEKLRESLQDEKNKSEILTRVLTPIKGSSSNILASLSGIGRNDQEQGNAMSHLQTPTPRGGTVSRNRLLQSSPEDEDDWGGRFSGLSVPQSPGLLNLIEQRRNQSHSHQGGLSVDDLQ